MTGYQANNEPTCGYTNTNEECNKYCDDGTCNTAYPNSVLASTTNNISGIFDMSGGAIDYVMGLMKDKEGKILIGLESTKHSNFNGILSCPTCNENNSGITEITNGVDLPDQKYGLVSRNTSDQSTYLASSWFDSGIDNLDQTHLFYARGGPYHDGKQVGIFASQTAYGQALSGWSFRIILTPTK